MESVGAEVGYKMRSAIRAKLMELGCYVDDELPDYIMVMVANKRSRSQMIEDLNLFLRADTEIFVEWLQQVLKKLKEVTITNPEVYASTSFKELKRKASLEIEECLIKKEKKDKKIKTEKKSRIVEFIPNVTSLTDEIPVEATKLVEKRMQNNKNLSNLANQRKVTITRNVLVDEDNFDIPSLSEVNDLDDSELDMISNKIIEARNRLVLMHSDSEEDEDFINIRAEAEELLGNEESDTNNSSTIATEAEPPPSSQRRIIKIHRDTNSITNQNVPVSRSTTPPIPKPMASPVKIPMSERLGAKPNPEAMKTVASLPGKHSRISLTETLREEKEISNRIRSSIQSIVKIPAEIKNVANKPMETPSVAKKQVETQSFAKKQTENKSFTKKPVENKIQKRESVHKRLGVPSSIVSLLKKQVEPDPKIEEHPKTKSVMSVVQVKPRRTLAGPCQANKNLLLKAVAEAQKSVSQMPVRGATVAEPPKFNNQKPVRIRGISNKEALFTKKYREQHKLKNDQKNIPVKESSDPENVSKVQNIIIEVNSNNSVSNADVLDEDGLPFVPLSLKKQSPVAVDNCDYVPNSLDLNYDEDLDKYMEDFDIVDTENSNDMIKEVTPKPTNHQFIVTLDGIKDQMFPEKENDEVSIACSEESAKPAKRVPSPIVFDSIDKVIVEKKQPVIPEKLPKAHAPALIKTKERCKYWPGCRLKEACDFIHPSTSCKMFPLCKFGDRCLYIHPKCKFDASCTRKDCQYSHCTMKSTLKIVARPAVAFLPAPQEVCKYHPNCSNPQCHFYHPKPCRFGKYCMNKTECIFSHNNIPNKEKLKWHSNIRM